MISQQMFVIALATVAQFIVGAVWYTPLFGKLWGKIHGFDKLDKKTQQKMMSQMGPIFGVQLVVTVITSIVMVILHQMVPAVSLYTLVLLSWIGFVVPAQVSGILFSGTEQKWMVTKSALMAGGSLVSLMSGAAVTLLLS